MTRRRRLELVVAVVVVLALLVARGVAWLPRELAARVGSSAPAPAASGPPSSAWVPEATSATAVATGAASGSTSSAAIDASQLDPRVTQATIAQTIGVSGWTKRVRPPVDVTQPIKLRLMAEHGYEGPPSRYELDHFIPLELGGSSNLSNLWLEPIAEARLKDKDENLAHRKVVTGAWTLAQGQQYMRDHWSIHYAP